MTIEVKNKDRFIELLRSMPEPHVLVTIFLSSTGGIDMSVRAMGREDGAVWHVFTVNDSAMVHLIYDDIVETLFAIGARITQRAT